MLVLSPISVAPMLPEEPRIQQLYPHQRREVIVSQLYLQHQLHTKGSKEHPFVYTNTIATLDGRIALEYPHSNRTSIPPDITSEIDQRLYQELAAQADVLLTSGRYLRQLDDGGAQSPRRLAMTIRIC